MLKLKEFYFEYNPLIPHIPVPSEQQTEVLPLKVCFYKIIWLLQYHEDMKKKAFQFVYSVVFVGNCISIDSKGTKKQVRSGKTDI